MRPFANCFGGGGAYPFAMIYRDVPKTPIACVGIPAPFLLRATIAPNIEYRRKVAEKEDFLFLFRRVVPTSFLRR